MPLNSNFVFFDCIPSLEFDHELFALDLRLNTKTRLNNHLDNNLQIWWPIMSIHHLCGFTCSGEMYRMHVKSLSGHIISCNSSHLCMIYYDKQTICHHIDWCESIRKITLWSSVPHLALQGVDPNIFGLCSKESHFLWTPKWVYIVSKRIDHIHIVCQLDEEEREGAKALANDGGMNPSPCVGKTHTPHWIAFPCLAPLGFDPRTFGLWAQHASSAPRSMLGLKCVTSLF